MTDVFKAALLALLVLAPAAVSAGQAGRTPEATLDAYFEVLTTRNVEGISDLMTSGSMARLKALMVEALEQEISRGGTSLQRRFYGKGVTLKTVEDTASDVFLNTIATEILNAADMQHFFVDNRKILGSVEESDDMVHLVVRLYLHQETRYNSDILVYTLIEEDGVWKLDFPPTIRQALAVFEAALRRQ